MPVRRPIANYEDFPAEYRQYNTQYPGPKEVIGWMWWDTVTYVSAATVNINLFNAIRATPDLSNMEVAGQFAAPKGFFVRAVRFYPKLRPFASAAPAATNVQTGIQDDIAQLLNGGVLTLTVGHKLYVQLPLWSLPGGGGVAGAMGWGAQAATTMSDYATNGIADARVVYSLAKPLFIAPQINFVVNLTWPAAITLVSGNSLITVALDGDLIRPIQ